MDTKKFSEYGGKHFIPAGRFEDMDFKEIVSDLSIDTELGFCKKGYVYDCKVPYDHKKFYEAAGCDDDLFRCIENGRLYVPCNNDLEWFMEPPNKVNLEMMKLRQCLPCKYRCNGYCTIYRDFCTSVARDVCDAVPDQSKVLVAISVKKETSIKKDVFITLEEYEKLVYGKGRSFIKEFYSSLESEIKENDTAYSYTVAAYSYPAPAY